jgi:hypothetical protein
MVVVMIMVEIYAMTEVTEQTEKSERNELGRTRYWRVKW